MIHIKTGSLKRFVVICVKIKDLSCCYPRKILTYTWFKRFYFESTLFVFVCMSISLAFMIVLEFQVFYVSLN
jgi:hypothetical protein